LLKVIKENPNMYVVVLLFK